MKTTICKVGKQTLAGLVLASVMAFGTVQAEEELIVCEDLDGLNSCLTYLKFTNEKDRTGLQKKLVEAKAKLEDKVCDAGLKVSDFNTKLSRLASASKPKVRDELEGLAVKCALEGSAALAKSLLIGCEPVSDPPRGKGPKIK